MSEDSEDSEDSESVAKKCICAACVRDKYLKREIRRFGHRGRCDYCQGQRKVMPIGEFAIYVETAFGNHYQMTSEEAGDPVAHLIQDAAEIDDVPAEDVRIVLEDRNGLAGKDALTEENPFSDEAHYRRGEVRAAPHHDEWARLRKSVETEARMFNGEAEKILDEIFEGLEDYATRHGKKVVVAIGPDCPISSLYRARPFQSQSDSKLEVAIGRPDQGLGPPPRELANAGRMNSRGIAVFYGATHPEVALAETRPPVGGRVLVGRFEITRHLWLLDVAAMRSIKAKGSIFDASYAENIERTAFLATLSAFIARPVMPEDEISEYLATQAIADYLATREHPLLDGIIYPSVQQKGRLKRNIVLFHKAARVHDLALPRHTQIHAHTYEHDEDGIREDYSVYVRKPPPKKESDTFGGMPFDGDELWDPFPDPRRDRRRPALRVDLSSLKVHHITDVRYREYNLPVRRHEYDMSEAELKRLVEGEPPF
jgi:hypothetical protein